jgi:hypothetical protein
LKWSRTFPRRRAAPEDSGVPGTADDINPTAAAR